MFRDLVRDSALYAVSGVFARAILVLQVPLFARTLGAKDFGSLDILVVTIALLNLVVPLEVAQGVGIYSSEAEDSAARNGYASTALWFTGFTYLAAGGLGLLFREPLAAAMLGDPGRADLIVLLMGTAAGQGLFTLTLNQLRWLLRPVSYLYVSLLSGVTNLGLSIFFVYGLDWGIAGVLGGQLSACVLALTVALVFARDVYRFTFDTTKLRQMLSFSFPLVFSSISIFLAIYVDRFVIKAVLGLEDVGRYAVAYRVASLIGVLIVGVNGAVTPLIYNRSKEPETPGAVARFLRTYLFAAIVFVTGLGLFAPQALIVFRAREYADVANIIPLLASAMVLSHLYVFAPGLSLAKRTRTIAIISITIGALNFLLNIVLVPLLGIAGAAAATAGSALVSFSAWWWLGRSLYRIEQRWVLVVGAAATGLGTALLWDRVLPDLGLIAELGFKAVAVGVVAVVCWLLVLRPLRQGTG